MVGATPRKIQIVLSHRVLKCQEIIHFSVFIPIHHSFGFSDIFLEGMLRPQRPPWILPCSLLCQTHRLKLNQWMHENFVTGYLHTSKQHV